MLTATQLHKDFALHDGRIVKAMDGVSFTIEQGKLYTLLGPSGCGKTTTLRSIAGLETPDRGRIAIGDTAVFDSDRRLLVPSNRRQIGMVFQSYAIWPHMDVYENVAFPLRVAPERTKESDVAARVRRALATVHLDGFERRPATRLSGGQQQRLALARALVMEPSVLLLDEPLSNLDAKLRESMRLELRRIQRELGITTVYVTHDQTEALAMSDTVAVMNNGRIVQEGDPQSIYLRPANRFVAEFIGSTNLLPGKLARKEASGAEAVVEIAGGSLRCVVPAGLDAGAAVLVSIRPEDASLEAAADAPAGTDGRNRLRGTVRDRIFLGSLVDHVVAVQDAELHVWCHPAASFDSGAEVVLDIDPARCIVLADRD
ncbi:MAG: ABC transporter ATP-binding protein [Rhodospirillaceae bacterium]|nr:ABC transporter ATP-binding protein [Rhodospirillaceae bacterium]